MATISKIGGIYHLDYKDADDVRRRPSLRTKNKEKALVKLRQYEHEQYVAEMQGIEILKKISYMDYQKIYLNWFERKYPATFITKRDNFINHLDVLFGDIYLNKLTAKKVTDYIWDLECRPLAASTINTILKDLRAFINHAKRHNYMAPKFIIEDVPDLESKPARWHSVEDLTDIYNNAPNNWHWWKLLANTGMRLGELQKLKCENVKPDAIHIVSTKTLRTKSGRWRVIKLNADAQEALAAFDQSGEFLLPSMKRTSVGNALRRACIRAGIKKGGYGVHCLRHSFGSHLAMSGVSMRAIQLLMGHGKSTTTERYAHLSPTHLQDSVDKISL